MAEQFRDVGGGIILCYETFGSSDDPPMLLIMGLGTQMIGQTLAAQRPEYVRSLVSIIAGSTVA